MRTELRIVAGSLRARKIHCTVGPHLRPTPQKVREALFSLLTNVVPGRRFVDVFAGTGIIGLEAISRGASSVTVVERDFRLAAAIRERLEELGVADKALLARTDTYRWIERWQPPREPVNVFVSPPFIDFQRRADALILLLRQLQEKVADNSIIVLQGEHDEPLEELPTLGEWEDRRYGRNHLLIWEKDGVELGVNEEKETDEA